MFNNRKKDPENVTKRTGIQAYYITRFHLSNQNVEKKNPES